MERSLEVGSTTHRSSWVSRSSWRRSSRTATRSGTLAALTCGSGGGGGRARSIFSVRAAAFTARGWGGAGLAARGKVRLVGAREPVDTAAVVPLGLQVLDVDAVPVEHLGQPEEQAGLRRCGQPHVTGPRQRRLPGAEAGRLDGDVAHLCSGSARVS